MLSLNIVGIIITIAIGVLIVYGLYLAWYPKPACPRCGDKRTDTIQFNPWQGTLYACRNCWHEWRADEERSWPDQ